MIWIARLNKPWLHFIVLGAVLFQLQSVLFPEPKTVIGPLSDTRISALQELWLTSTGRRPKPEQIEKFIAAELDRDMLLQRALELNLHLYDTIVYQRLIRNMNFLQLAEGKSGAELFNQALEMQLHLDDQVVKRRLIQVMEQQLLAENSPAKPSVEEIASAFSDRKGELQRPPLYSIEHVFFARDRESEASAFVATVTEQMLDIQAARRLGSPFLQGHQFTRQTPVQLTKNFGKDFVIRLEQALAESQSQMKQQQWLGPIPSAYGLHYVWLTAFEPARAAELREVEQQLRHDLEYVAKNKALQCAIAALRNNYDIRGRELKGSEQKDANVSNGEGCQ